MIDITTETLITPAQYTRMRPPGRGGRPMALSTAYRHFFEGVRGIKLEHVKLGGQTYTSVEAVRRFAERLTDDTGRGPGPATVRVQPNQVRTLAARRRASEQTERELDKAGIR